MVCTLPSPSGSTPPTPSFGYEAALGVLEAAFAAKILDSNER